MQLRAEAVNPKLKPCTHDHSVPKLKPGSSLVEGTVRLELAAKGFENLQEFC